MVLYRSTFATFAPMEQVGAAVAPLQSAARTLHIKSVARLFSVVNVKPVLELHPPIFIKSFENGSPTCVLRYVCRWRDAGPCYHGGECEERVKLPMPAEIFAGKVRNTFMAKMWFVEHSRRMTSLTLRRLD